MRSGYWVTVRVEDCGGEIIINEQDAKEHDLMEDVDYQGYYLDDKTMRIELKYLPRNHPSRKARTDRAEGEV